MIILAIKIQEDFAITQETHLLGVIFIIIHRVARLLMGRHATINGKDCM
jgi:hypothetical protein